MPSTICSSPRLLVRLPVSPSFLFCRIQKPVNARAGTCRYAIQKLFSRRDNLFPRRGNSFCAPQRHVLPCVEPTLFVRCDHFPETAAGITDPTIAEDYSIMMQSPLAVGWGRLPHEDNAHGLPSHCKGRGRVSNFSNTGIRWATPLGSCQHVSCPGGCAHPSYGAKTPTASCSYFMRPQRGLRSVTEGMSEASTPGRRRVTLSRTPEECPATDDTYIRDPSRK